MKKLISIIMSLSIVLSMSFVGGPVYAATGEWSDWSTAAPPSDASQVEQKVQYRYCDKSTTKSGNDTLSGWTKYDTSTSTSTSAYKFGTPISSSTTYSDTQKIVKSAVNKGYYYYAYSVANPNKTSDWTYYVSTSRASVISHMKANFSAASAWSESRLRYFWYISSSDLGSLTGTLNKTIPYCADSNVSKGTVTQSGTHLYDLKLWKYKQCYKIKTVTTTNYFYKWSSWTAWSDNAVASSSTRQVQTRTLYRYRYSDTKSDPKLKFENSSMNKYVRSSDFANRLDYTTDSKIKYSSSNVDVATVDPDTGVIHPVAEGVTVIYATAVETDYYLSGSTCFPLTISKSSQSITAKTSYSKRYGNKAFNLDASAETSLTYSSSNTDVLAVSSTGNVTIKGVGSATITIKAQATDEYKAASKKVTVTVEKGTQKITTGADSYSKTCGCSVFSLAAKAKTKLTYSSSNRAVAVVSSTGKVTIKAPGTATITVKAASGTKYKAATKKVTVKAKLKKAATPKVSKVASSKVKVSWGKVSKAGGYQVYVKRASDGKVIQKNTTDAFKIVKGITKGKSYKIKVRAYKSVNGKKVYGAWSDYRTYWH